MRETFARIWKFSEKRHKTLVKSLIFSFIRSVFGLCQMFAVLLAVRALLGEVPVHSALWQVAALTAVCVGGNFVTSYFEQIGTLETDFYMIGDKRVSIGGVLRRVPLGFFSTASAGRVIATLTTTLSGVETAAAMVMVGIVSGLFSAVSLVLFMLVYDWRIGLLSGAGMVCYLLVVSWQMRVSRTHAPGLMQVQNRLAERTLTFLQGIRVTKSYSFQRGDGPLKQAIRDSCDSNIGLTDRSMPSQFAAGLTAAVFESGILLLSLWLCFRQGELPLVRTLVLLIFSFLVYGSLNQAGSMLSMIGLLDAGLQEAQQLEQAEPLPQVLPEQKPASREIRFHHVSFSYGDRQVLHDITTAIRPNTLTAVIGPSGSGKTTFCQLIPRFRDVTRGTITLGGADIRTIPYDRLMEQVSMVFQNVYLFEDTVFNNIRFGRPDATREQVEAAAKKARCHDFIMALPQGYDTVVEESGSNLSGGERQRISIARAILKDAPIVILDEATSALDTENEHEILGAMEALTRDKTVIMIAHRLASVQRADRVIALRDGRIVQEGTNQELAAQPGLYRDFLNARKQAAGWQL